MKTLRECALAKWETWRVGEKLETWGKRTGVPALIFVFVGLLGTGVNVLISVWTYQRLVAADRPSFVTITSRLTADDHRHTLDLGWKNVGKKTARNGKAKVFDLGEDGKRGDLLGEKEITGTFGTKVFAGDAGGSLYDVDKLPKRILVCVTYFDDDERVYNQALELAPKSGPTDNPNVLFYLDEAKTPDVKICQ